MESGPRKKLVSCFALLLIASWGVAGSMLGWIPELGSVWNISPEFEVRTGQIIHGFAPVHFKLTSNSVLWYITLFSQGTSLHFTNKQFIQNVLRLEVCVCSLVRLITVLWAIFHVKSCWWIAFPALNQGLALLFIPSVSSLLSWYIPWARHVQNSPEFTEDVGFLTQLTSKTCYPISPHSIIHILWGCGQMFSSGSDCASGTSYCSQQWLISLLHLQSCSQEHFVTSLWQNELS